MEKYGLLNKTGTDIIEERFDNSTKLLTMPDNGPKLNPTHDDFIEAGWVLYVQPVYGVHEKEGPQSIDLDDRTYTNEKIPWTQEEIDFETEIEAKAPQLESINLDFLSGPFAYATKEQAIELINQKIDPVLYPGINWTCRKLADNLVQLNTFRRLTLEEHKNVLDAVVPPSVNDDLSQGFTVGSLWRNTLSGIDYKLIDSKVGDALWVEV